MRAWRSSPHAGRPAHAGANVRAHTSAHAHACANARTDPGSRANAHTDLPGLGVLHGPMVGRLLQRVGWLQVHGVSIQPRADCKLSRCLRNVQPHCTDALARLAHSFAHPFAHAGAHSRADSRANSRSHSRANHLDSCASPDTHAHAGAHAGPRADSSWTVCIRLWTGRLHPPQLRLRRAGPVHLQVHLTVWLGVHLPTLDARRPQLGPAGPLRRVL